MAAEPPPPISGGTLIVLRDGVTAVAADADRDRIYVVDLTDVTKMVLRASIALTAHDQPGRLVEDGTGLVHVSLRNAGALVTVDPVAGKITARRSVCAMPRGLAYDARADRLHVACAGGELMTFTPTGATAERILKFQRDLRDVVVDGPRLIVTRFRSAEVMVLDTDGTMLELTRPSSYTNQSVHGGSPFGPAVAWRTVAMPDGGAVMVHQRGMNGTVGETPGGYGGFSPCDTIVHTSVTKMKFGEGPVAGPAMPGFVLPVDVAISADGMRVAMVAAGNGHTQGDGRRLFVANVDDVTGEWDQGCGMDDKHGPSPSPGCTSTGTGTRSTPPPAADGTCQMGLFVCNGLCISTSEVCVSSTAPGMTDPSGGGAATGAGGDTGSSGAGGAAVSGTAGSMGTGSVECGVDLPTRVEPVSVAFAGLNQVVVQTREPAQLWVVGSAGAPSALNMIALSQESRADTGHAVFHSNSGGGLACASCHPEGHEDGRVWDFQCEGSRRTQDLSGGLSGTEPFHWNGDLGDFPKLVDTVFVGRMSGPALSREQTAAALHWINTVPAKTAVRASIDAQAVRGKEIFNNPAIGCATCHTGVAFTNNKTVDVGTSGLFQVPSLRGVGWRSPYMHDGCAPTLAGRFGNKFCDGGDAHGKTTQLTPPQIDDLVAYLESL